MARVTSRAVPPLTALEAEDTPALAATSATATAARCVVGTRKGAAQAPSASERKRQGVTERGTRDRGEGACLKAGAPPRRESPNMQSPEAWTRKRMRETHATQRSRTTGATGARKSEAATTGRHAALHARARSDGESGQDGQESTVDTPEASTANESWAAASPLPLPLPPAPRLFPLPTGCCGGGIGRAGTAGA
eukprot:6121937-Pleurochrysis_carterae.AAC.1